MMKLIVKMKFGSHLYGTSNENSDTDYKGIFMPSKTDILLNRVPKSYSYNTGDSVSKNTSLDEDCEVYSLHYFMKLACDGQTVALDMLHAPADMIIESSEVWDAIVSRRKEFYTKNLKAFIGYARRQASKYGIKGSRLNAVAKVMELLRYMVSKKRLRDIWDLLPRGEHCYDVESNPNGIRQYQVCGKIFQETASVEYVLPILEKYHNDYGERARQAAENKNIDWKAVSHAVRAALQVKDILTNQDMTFPLKEAKTILSIKEGKLDYLTEVAPLLEALMDEVEILSLNSNLPSSVDRAAWDSFICKTIEEEYF